MHEKIWPLQRFPRETKKGQAEPQLSQRRVPPFQISPSPRSGRCTEPLAPPPHLALLLGELGGVPWAGGTPAWSNFKRRDGGGVNGSAPSSCGPAEGHSRPQHAPAWFPAQPPAPHRLCGAPAARLPVWAVNPQVWVGRRQTRSHTRKPHSSKGSLSHKGEAERQSARQPAQAWLLTGTWRAGPLW